MLGFGKELNDALANAAVRASDDNGKVFGHFVCIYLRS